MNALTTARHWLEREIDFAAQAFSSAFETLRRPRRLRIVEQPEGDFALTAARGGSELARLRHGEDAWVAASGLTPRLAGAEVEVVLNASRFLFREIELPRQAGEFLGGVVRAQIDRLTPWTARDAAFGWSAPASLGSDRIGVKVAAAPRGAIAGFVQALESARVRSWTLCARAENNVDESIQVLAGRLGGAGRERALRRILAGALALSAFAALSSALASLFVGGALEAESESLRRDIASRRAALVGGDGSAAQQSLAALNARKRADPPSVIVIEALSRALPDDTYLTQLHLEGSKVRIVGLTQDAPGLIRQIEQSEYFKRAAFDAPTTQTSGERGERFHIEALAAPVFTVRP